MSQTHLLSDTIARINNSQAVKQRYVVVYYSKNIEKVLRVLITSGYIDSIKKLDIRKGVSMIKVHLKYEGKTQNPVISQFNIVSKPGKRIYRSYKKLNKIYGGLGTTVLSTSKGVITDSEARSIKAGGEVLCNIF